MKFKTTAKEIKNNYHYIIGVGYCELQSLLAHTSPIAYSSGIYGWNCDYYEIITACNRVLICTGYRNIISKNTKVDYKTIQTYENKAIKINESKLPSDKRQAKIKKLLEKFVDDCIVKQSCKI
jgi:hypothetical protein